MNYQLSKDISKLINKYISNKIYVVFREYIKNDIHKYKDYFGTYSSYDRAYTSVIIEIKHLYKKYKQHKYDKTENFSIDYYEDVVNGEMINYFGTINYTNIYTIKHTIKNQYNFPELQSSKYIYHIQDHYLNNKNIEDGIGITNN